ncbi:hypothetical protein Y032_0065g3658 [Ancylostoma ceylanicum]|uniref:Uncharacterized protein n=1 Tax=Ancylostoma ceylanicum TaxID=53326 RepID=A0A016U0Y9_9BILA|nr:hypothetical protein Y032_0065g3658 [Ancylostoma ceylanicum]
MERAQRSNDWSHSLVTKQEDCYEVYRPPQDDCYEVYIPPQDDCYEVYAPPAEGCQQGRCSPLFEVDRGYAETASLNVQQSNQDYRYEVYRSHEKSKFLHAFPMEGNDKAVDVNSRPLNTSHTRLAFTIVEALESLRDRSDNQFKPSTAIAADEYNPPYR